MNYHSNALETAQWSLEIDLKKDLESFMERQMRKMNIPPSGTRSIMYEYFNTQKRVIFETPRKVVYSREFQCPEEYQEALSQFERRSRSDCVHEQVAKRIANVRFTRAPVRGKT